MKRLWLGIGILAVLLAVSCVTSSAMGRIHTPIADDLEAAAAAASREDWEKTKALAERAKARWEQYWYFTATVADHTPMDEIESLFAELEVYLQEQEMPHFSATSRQLAQLAASMADSQKPVWWNFL